MMFAIIGRGVYYFLTVIFYAILIRSLLSWFVDPFSRAMGFLSAMVEPFVAPVRRLLSRFSGASMQIDFSPAITGLIILFVREVILRVFM